MIATAATAPAFAASPCDVLAVSSFPFFGGSTGTQGTGNNQTRTWSRTLVTPTSGGGSSPIQLSATSSYSGSMGRAADQSTYAHFGTTANAGGTGTAGLQMFQERGTSNVGTGNAGNSAGTYTYTFSRAVTNLQFTLSDIDYYAYTQGFFNPTEYRQYDDRVAVSSLQGGFTVQSRGANIVSTSAGTVSDPFRTSTTGQAAGNIDLDEGAGNAVVKFAGPITSFSITYWNGFDNANTSSRIQVSLISNMSFTYQPCN